MKKVIGIGMLRAITWPMFHVEHRCEKT